MRFRDYLQESRIDIGTSGTKTFNLDYTDPITQLDLYFEGTNGSAGNVESPFEKCISKIEIVDGGEVLWDLPGEVALALFSHDNGAMPYSEIEEAYNGSVRQQMPIRFGLKLYDPVYAFDPRKHKNPQLKFTFNEAAVNTAGTTGYVSDSWTFSLMVRLMEDAPAPKGFLASRIVESFTSAGTGARRVEMPVDKTIRYLICRAAEDDTALYTTITNHKLSMNGGKFIPFDLAARDFINRMCETFPPIWRRFLGLCQTDVTRETFMGVPLHGHVTDIIEKVICSGNFYIDGRVNILRGYYDATTVAETHVLVSNNGWALHSTLIYPFGDRMKPEHWLVPDPNGKLDYYVTDGDAGADVDICLQQVYKY